MNLKDWLKGLVTSVDPFLNVAQRLIQSWYSPGKEIPPARRPHMVFARGIAGYPAETGAKRNIWTGVWTDRSRYPGNLLRAIRKWFALDAKNVSGYELGWARQLAIGAA